MTSYLRYEPCASFGVIATASVPSVPLPASKYPVPLIVSAGVDAVQIWSLRKGDVLARYSNADIRKSTTISALCVSPDGSTIAAGYVDGSVRTWNVVLDGNVQVLPDKQPVATFNGHRSRITSISFEFAPNTAASNSNKKKNNNNDKMAGSNRLVSASADGDIILWDLPGENGIFRLPAHNDVVTSVLLTKHQARHVIISASKDGLVRIYDIETQHCIQTVVGHRAEVWAMTIDPTHSLLLTGSVDEEVRLFKFIDDEDISDDKSEVSPEDVVRPLGAVKRQNAVARVGSIDCVYSHGEHFALVTGNDRTAELFRIRSARDAEKHKVRRRKRFMEKQEKRKEENNNNNNMELFADGAAEETETFVDAVEAKDFLVSVRAMRMKSKFRGVRLLDDGYQLAPKKSNSLQVYFLMQTSDNALDVYKIIASKKIKKRKKPADDGDAGIDQDDDGEEVGVVEKVSGLDRCGHRGDVRSISMSPDERRLLSTSKKALKLWNVAEGNCVRSMQPMGFGLCTAFLGADGAFGAVGSKEGSLEVFDLRNGNVVAQIEQAHKGAVWSMSLDNHLFEADHLITAGADKVIRFWKINDLLDVEKDKVDPVRKLTMADEVLAVCIAGGRERPLLMASLMDSTIRAVFLDTLEPAMNFYGHKLPVMAMDVSSDGQLLATGSADKTVKIWGIDFGDCRRSLRAHSDSVVSVSFQPNTHYFFSGSRDGTLKYWDGDKFEFIAEMEGQRGEVWSLAVSMDGEIVASASHDKLLRVWKRTDTQLFLTEEQDKRMDEMLDAALIEDDVKAARKERGTKIEFLDDSNQEALRAGKVTLDTVKGGEGLLRAFELIEEENMREKEIETRNPELLGLGIHEYLMMCLGRIRTADLEEVMHVLPLKQAMLMLKYCGEILEKRPLQAEILVRAATQLVRIHENQIIAGAVDRTTISKLLQNMKDNMRELERRMGMNMAALEFWKTELATADNSAFRDAAARASNLAKKRKRRAGQ